MGIRILREVELTIGELANKASELLEVIADVTGISITATKKITGGYGVETSIYEICNKIVKNATNKWMERFTISQMEGVVEILEERLEEVSC